MQIRKLHNWKSEVDAIIKENAWRGAKRILVGIDTSNWSIAKLKAIQLLRHLDIYHQSLGITIEVMECDLLLARHYNYKGEIPPFLEDVNVGYDHIIQYANEFLNPDCILILTGGKTSYPCLKSRFPIQWILTSKEIDETWKRQSISRML